MSPESYVLLLISCWLLLASALLWGMLRIARRHYSTNGLPENEAEHSIPRYKPGVRAAENAGCRTRALPQLYRGQLTRLLCAPAKFRS